MSLENRKRQYKMFMEREENALAAEQIKGHPEILEQIKAEKAPEKEKKSEPETKSKRRK